MPEDKLPDYYSDLEISPLATQKEIQSKYDELKQWYQSDNPRIDEQERAEVLSRIEKAYEILSDPDKRRDFDRGYQTREAERKKENILSQLEWVVGTYKQPFYLYDVLELAYEVTARQKIEEQYKAQIRKHFRDEEKKKIINIARDILIDPEARQLYFMWSHQESGDEEKLNKIAEDILRQKEEAEEDLRRQKKEAEEQIDEYIRQRAREVREQAGTTQEQQSVPRQNFSGDFPPPPQLPKEISKKQTGKITWKAPPSPARPPSFFRRKNIIILIVLAVVLAGGVGGIRLLSNKMQIVSFTVDQNKVVVGTNVLFTITLSAPFSVLPFWESGREVGIVIAGTFEGGSFQRFTIQDWHSLTPCESNGGITCTMTYAVVIAGTFQFQAYIHDQYHDDPIGPIHTLSVTWCPESSTC